MLTSVSEGNWNEIDIMNRNLECLIYELLLQYMQKCLSNSWFEVEGLRGLPSEVWVLAAEVTERSCLLVNGSLQVELLDDVARSEVEVFPNNPHDVLISATVFSRTVNFDMDREGIGEVENWLWPECQLRFNEIDLPILMCSKAPRTAAQVGGFKQLIESVIDPSLDGYRYVVQVAFSGCQQCRCDKWACQFQPRPHRQQPCLSSLGTSFTSTF